MTIFEDGRYVLTVKNENIEKQIVDKIERQVIMMRSYIERHHINQTNKSI